MRALFCALMLVLGIAAQPAQAARVDFWYAADPVVTSFGDPDLGYFTYAFDGSGYFVGPDSGTFDVGQITEFYYVQNFRMGWTTSLGTLLDVWDTVYFGLSNLTSFSATISANSLTDLSLSTDFLAGIAFTPPIYQTFGVTGLGPNGAFAYDLDGYFPTQGEFYVWNLTPSGSSVPPVSAVPEPASWAMLISGFGLIGFAMRRAKAREAGIA